MSISKLKRIRPAYLLLGFMTAAAVATSDWGQAQSPGPAAPPAAASAPAPSVLSPTPAATTPSPALPSTQSETAQTPAPLASETPPASPVIATGVLPRDLSPWGMF